MSANMEVYPRAAGGPPWLFQAPDGTLDLQTLSGGDPVVVSVFLPDAAAGDNVIVHFGSKTQSFTVADPDKQIQDVLFPADTLPVTGRTHDIWYEWGKVTSATVSVELIDSADALSPRLHYVRMSGIYPPGSIDAWIVPRAYHISPGTSPIVKSLGGANPSGDMLLPITRTRIGDDPVSIGRLSYTVSTEEWTVEINEDEYLLRADLLCIRLPGESPESLSFSVAL
jgi:hypothetical protein